MRAVLHLVAVATTVFGGACVDARQAFDDYGKRLPDAAPPIDAPIVSTLPDVTGTFYSVAAPPTGADQRLFHLLVTFVFTPVTENTGKLDFSAQALDYTTFAPVGDPFVSTDVDVHSDATADIPMIGLLDHRANSVSGTDAQVNAVVHAQLISTDFSCGTLTGIAGPLNLEGTTFAGQRVASTDPPFPTPIYVCQ